MSNARVLVIRFLTHSDWMIWVSATFTSVVDLCLKPPSWLWWMKLLEIIWNWRYSPIIFSKSFPIVLKRTIEQYDLEESNIVLLDLGITTMVEVLKWDSQYPKSIHVLVISISLQIHSSLLIIDLRYLQVSLSESRANKLLHFSIILISSFLKNGFYTLVVLSGILSRIWRSISLAWAKLNELWRAFHRFSSSIHRHLSYWMASITGSLHFLTQFISSHGPHFLFTISSILSSKKDCLDFLTMLLKSF